MSRACALCAFVNRADFTYCERQLTRWLGGNAYQYNPYVYICTPLWCRDFPIQPLTSTQKWRFLSESFMFRPADGSGIMLRNKLCTTSRWLWYSHLQSVGHRIGSQDKLLAQTQHAAFRHYGITTLHVRGGGRVLTGGELGTPGLYRMSWTHTLLLTTSRSQLMQSVT